MSVARSKMNWFQFLRTMCFIGTELGDFFALATQLGSDNIGIGIYFARTGQKFSCRNLTMLGQTASRNIWVEKSHNQTILRFSFHVFWEGLIAYGNLKILRRFSIISRCASFTVRCSCRAWGFYSRKDKYQFGQIIGETGNITDT